MLIFRLCRPFVVVCLVSFSNAVLAEIDFSAGGFFKLHAMSGDISPDRNLRADQELFFPQIAVEPAVDADSWRSHLHARTSRLWLRAQQPGTALGDVEFMLEADLFGENRRYRPRLRHAYLVAGRLLAGKSWSTFANASALADIDAGTVAANIVTRHHQLRWTQPVNANWQWQLAVETPLNRLHFAGSNNIVAHIYQSRPDLVLRVNNLHENGNLSISAMRREITVAAPWRGAQDSVEAMALSIAGRQNIGILDNLRYTFSYGNGLASYGPTGTFADAVVKNDGRLDLNPAYSAMLALQHYWTPKWRTTLAWSTVRNTVNDAAARVLNRDVTSTHINLIWAPGTDYSVGVEYLHATRSQLDSRDGELQRLQLTLRINF